MKAAPLFPSWLSFRYPIVGAPHREVLETAFSRTQNILRRSSDVKLVSEADAEQFAAWLADEMAEHGVSPPTAAKTR